LKRNGQQI